MRTQIDCQKQKRRLVSQAPPCSADQKNDDRECPEASGQIDRHRHSNLKTDHCWLPFGPRRRSL